MKKATSRNYVNEQEQVVSNEVIEKNEITYQSRKSSPRLKRFEAGKNEQGQALNMNVEVTKNSGKEIRTPVLVKLFELTSEEMAMKRAVKNSQAMSMLKCNSHHSQEKHKTNLCM